MIENRCTAHLKTFEACCPVCTIDKLRQQLTTLQKDNDTLNTDLKEAEGAVADLMVVNDRLTEEVKKQHDQWDSNFCAMEQVAKDNDERAEKAEAELERRTVVGNKIHIRTRDRRLKLEAEVETLTVENNCLSSSVKSVTKHAEKTRIDLNLATQLLSRGVQAMCFTRDYVGGEILPAVAGWSWFDFCVEFALHHPEDKWSHEFRTRVDLKCDHGKGLKDYCQPCGRIHGS